MPGEGRSSRTRVQCPDCFQFLLSEMSDLAHARYCKPPPTYDGSYQIGKRMRRTGLFSAGPQVGLGPGKAVRREDVGVMVAVEPCVDFPENTGDPALPAKGSVAAATTSAQDANVVRAWTSDATGEEVTEAIRRALLRCGTSLGEKETNLIINLFRHPSYCPDIFRSRVTSLKAVQNEANQDLEQCLRSLQFEKHNVTDRVEDATAGMWRRNPLDVVRRQVQQLSFNSIGTRGTQDVDEVASLYTQCFQEMGADGERRFCHPLSTDLAASVFKRVRSRVMHACAAGEKGVHGWRDSRDFVLLVQLYSDKSSQTMKTSSHTHFPLHVAVMNTSLSMKEKMICAGDCVVGYLPTDIKWEDEEAKAWTNDLADAVSGRGSRASKLRILQNSIEACLKPLLDKTVPGFDVADSKGVPRRCHPVLWSYVTDLPEGWDVSSGVHFRCSRCHVQNSELNSTKPSTAKTATTIVKFFDQLEGACANSQSNMNKKQIMDSMWSKSIAPVRPFLLSLGDNFGIDMYKSLRYEVMHNIHHGLTRTLLECLSLRLMSTELSSPELVMRKGSTSVNRTFASIRTSVLRALNNSLELFDRQSPAIDFKVRHRCGGKTEVLNGLFQKNGLASMLEAREYAQILQVMPFVAATCDRLCGEPGTTTSLFVRYVELVFQMTRVTQATVSFSRRDIDSLRQSIGQFMEAATELYGPHNRKGMAIPKMHALLHVADDIIEGGALAHYRADPFEASHKKVKAAYNAGSRRSDTGHGEALAKMARADYMRMDSGKTDRGARIDVVDELSQVRPRTRGARTKAKTEAVENDAVVLSRPNSVIPAAAIQKFMRECEGDDDTSVRARCKQRARCEHPEQRELHDLLSDLGRPSDFMWFMETLQLRVGDSVSRSMSATLPGFPYPEAVMSVENKTMLITVDRPGEGDAADRTVQRELQRCVAAHSFHRSAHRVQMVVMIEAEGPEATKSKLHRSAGGKYASCAVREVHVAKVLAFLTVRRTQDEDGFAPQTSAVEEVALIQYMDVCNDEPDVIEKALGCVKLTWAQEFDPEGMDAGMDSMLCQYAVVDIGAIRGVLHVVRGDYGLGQTVTHGCEGDRHWAECWFYVNRFKVERRGARLFMDGDAP